MRTRGLASRRVRTLGGLLGIALSFLVVAAAVACYGDNRGAGIEYMEPYGKGVLGIADLVSAQPLDPYATTIVHPAQIGMASGDFVGWGTMKGAGTNVEGAISNCPGYTGTRWQLYVDGFDNDRYFCRRDYGSEPDVASNQHFEIRHTMCNGQTRWAFFWNTVLKTCQAVDGVQGYPSVGGESVGANPQKIDVHYRELQYRVLGGTWTDWDSNRFICEDATWYDVTGSGTDYWVKKK